MKKVIISVLISLFIMLFIPMLVVELIPPKNNANSTAPAEPTVTDNE